MAGPRDCQLCQLQQEMKRIPASYFPISVKTGLSQILDPMRVLPKNDYRYFAECNGLTPQTVQWLDSQKTQFNTSSIIAILNYLTDIHGDRFTIYQVYKTLCHMKSDGQRIICEGMPEIRSLFHQGTRPGQENSEPASVNLPALPRERSPSPPPPYDSNVSQHSVYMAGGECAAGLNDLGCSPQDAGNRHVHGGQNSYHRLDVQEGNGLGVNIALSQQMAGRQHGRPVACEASFIPPSDPASGSHSNGFESSALPANHPQRLDYLRFGRREAAENSSSFNNTEDGSIPPPSPPSYVESELQHRRTQRKPWKPHTTMEELKSPLEGPEVTPGHSPGPRLPRNIPPADADGSCLCGGRQSSSSRPESFPKYSPSSYQRRHDATRPVSNNVYCSHLGDCSCYSYSEECGPFSIVSDVSAEGHPWNTERHQTGVKQRIASHHNGNLSPQQPAAPQNNCQPSGTRRLQSAPEMRTKSTAFTTRNVSGLSHKFVFVVAADISETERLDQQVEAFCQELERYGIGHVVVRSTSQTPLVALHPSVVERLPPLLSDFQSVQKFVWSCYKRAAKVLMLVTPGYQRYADDCAEGSQKSETRQQKLMRKIQEKLKEEFCNRDIPFRIWPVLLHEMKANRVHLPFFLSDAVYYWFPLNQGAENVMEVLDEYLCVRSADVKRSF